MNIQLINLGLMTKAKPKVKLKSRAKVKALFS